jgi:FAD/FMN-containing dehydrogenase
MKRRNFLKAATVATLCPAACLNGASNRESTLVNDVHSQLNATSVSRVVSPDSLDQSRQVILRCAQRGESLCLSGARHSMGGQQFATNHTLVDVRRLKRVLEFDAQLGQVEVEAGIQWSELVSWLLKRQQDQDCIWTIAQKQTGANDLTLAGALASNIHGRGLLMRPFVSDVESFQLIDAEGRIRHCSREENRDLFRLAIGGYGLFGMIYSVRLRLVPRRKLMRHVEVIEIDQLIAAFDQKVREGCLYGDFQFAIDRDSKDFLRKGVFSCYRTVEAGANIGSELHRLSPGKWRELILLAHADPSRAFQLYAEYYLKTSGQLYWSDLHQFSHYVENYHQEVEHQMHSHQRASEMITEVYVPRTELVSFMTEAAEQLRRSNVPVIYGTVRRIEQDQESFLAWARQPYACVVFNLHTEHSPAGIERAARTFRRLIDFAMQRGGSFYLTYHRFATREQVEGCYPQFQQFLREKAVHDPERRFQSDWYRHHQQLFSGEPQKKGRSPRMDANGGQ